MKKISIFIAILFSSILFSSCEKLVEGLDVDPNNPADAPANLQLTGAQVASILVYEGELARLSGMWSEQFTGSDRQYITLENYNAVSGDFDSPWGNIYSNVIAQTKIIRQKADEANNPWLKGIAQVMEAQMFGTTTSLFGDIPFSQAAQAEMFPTPVYDPQPQVYAGVQALLDSGITNLSAPAGLNPGQNDVFYQGDLTKWISAARTLKARFYLHTEQYDLAAGQAQMGIMDTTGASNMMAPHGESYAADFNVYYSFLVYDRPAYMSAEAAYAPQLLNPDTANPLYRGNIKTNETARFNFYYIPGGGIYNNGTELNFQSAADGWVATDSLDGFFGTDTPFPLVTFEENMLILAESRARLGDLPGALAALNTVRRYLDRGDNISPGYYKFGLNYEEYLLLDFTPGIGIANPEGLPVEQALLKEILEEKYITLLGRIEVFNDIRRTDNLIGVPTNREDNQIPQRFLYPQSELNTNPNTPRLGTTDLFRPTPVNE
jgi:hypothetical protein